MKLLLLLISMSIVLSSKAAVSVYQQTDTTGQHILIVNAFDAADSKARKNKKELFTELSDSLKVYLHTFLAEKKYATVTTIPQLLKDTTTGNLLNIISEHNATMAIVITGLDVGFEKTDVAVTRDYNGSKSRTATYDICCVVYYNIYRPGMATINSDEKNCEYFSTRMVASGLLAAGPDVVGKKKYTYRMVQRNAFDFIHRNGNLLDK